MKQVLLLVGLLAIPGCGAFQKVVEALPTVIQYVSDAQIILDRIDQSVRPLIALKKDEALNEAYAKAMDSTRSALQVALRSVKGGQNLSEDQVDAAFADFRTAYVELRTLLQNTGLMGGSGTLAAAPGVPVVAIPEPLAMGAR